MKVCYHRNKMGLKYYSVDVFDKKMAVLKVWCSDCGWGYVESRPEWF